MITDLRNDMKAECEKFGEVRKVIVFDVSINSISFTISFLFTFKRDSSKLRPPIGIIVKKGIFHLSFIIIWLVFVGDITRSLIS